MAEIRRRPPEFNLNPDEFLKFLNTLTDYEQIILLGKAYLDTHSLTAKSAPEIADRIIKVSDMPVFDNRHNRGEDEVFVVYS